MADWAAYQQMMSALDLNELLKDTNLNELLKDADLNQLLIGFSISDLLTDEQLKQYFGDIDPSVFEGFGFAGGRDMFGGMGGGMRGLQSSSDIATTDFILTRENTGFTNIIAAQKSR